MAENTHGTLPTNRQRHKITVSAEGLTKQVVKIVPWATYGASVPAIGSADSETSGFYLATVEIERKGKLAEILLNYVTRGDGTGLPDTTYVETTTSLEKPIQQHPHFADWAADWDTDTDKFKPGTSKYGIESYIGATTQVTKTTYHTSLPTSERDNIGTRQSPGSGYGSSAKWILTDSTRRKEGYFFIKENIYLFDKDGWNEDIYP